MANTYSALYYHIVFSTKHRERWILSAAESRLWEVIAGIARHNNISPIRIGGTDDHIHALVSIPPALPIAKAVQYLKGGSSKWAHQEFAAIRISGWQDGYAAFTVSKSQIRTVREYIRTQREHHARLTYQDEIRAMLLKHGVDFDERYVWG